MYLYGTVMDLLYIFAVLLKLLFIKRVLLDTCTNKLVNSQNGHYTSQYLYKHDGIWVTYNQAGILASCKQDFGLSKLS